MSNGEKLGALVALAAVDVVLLALLTTTLILLIVWLHDRHVLKNRIAVLAHFRGAKSVEGIVGESTFDAERGVWHVTMLLPEGDGLPQEMTLLSQTPANPDDRFAVCVIGTHEIMTAQEHNAVCLRETQNVDAARTQAKKHGCLAVIFAACALLSLGIAICISSML